MVLSPEGPMLWPRHPLKILLSTIYRLICRVKRFTPCVAMHNGNRFNEATQANQGLCFTQRLGEDTMATLPDMLRAEVARCQNLARTYTQLGTAGAFANALLDESLCEAEQALHRNECDGIERALMRLRAFRDVTPDRPVARIAARPRFEARPVVAQPQPQRLYMAPQRPASQPAGWGPAHAVLQEQFFTWTRAA